MSRRSVQSVSLLLALTPCGLGEEDGFVGGQTVRIVTTDEILSEYRKWKKAPRKKGQVDWETLAGLSLLQRATETKDLTAGRSAVRMLEPFLRTILKPGPGEKNPEELVTQIISAVPFEAMGEQWFLPRLMTAAVKGATPVYWEPGKAKKHGASFNPPQRGMFCPTYEIAVAFRMFFNGIRVCLRCQSLFSKERPNQGCCSIECREAHRVNRWRESKKTAGTRKGKK